MDEKKKKEGEYKSIININSFFEPPSQDEIKIAFYNPLAIAAAS